MKGDELNTMENIGTVPLIIFIVYFAIWCLKLWVLKTDKARKNIPPIAAALGCGIALLFFFLAPAELPFDGIVDCCTQGIASGLAAVGFNQIFKQLKRYGGDDSVTIEEDVPLEEKNDASDDDRVGG